MAQIDVDIERRFAAPSFDAAWSYLRDARQTLAHYPKLQNLVDLGDDTWRWELEPTGTRGFSHQVIYTVVYRYDEQAGEIVWDPVKNEGNAQVNGSFTIVPDGDDGRVRVDFHTHCEFEIPAPRMLRSMIGPFVRREFTAQIDRFIDNLEKAIDGG